MSEALAVKYRPKTFDQVISQSSVVKILTRQIETKKYKNLIFAGPSGSGKTTLARILAYKINEYRDESGNLCSAEPIEIDAASNSGVDNVRNIIDGANTRSLDGEYKIYIIDEAHALTSQSWNALLKTIEESPKYTIFIFCTTEFHKIPETIQNRCQLFFLNRVDDSLICNRLEEICSKEGFTFDREALLQISKMSSGSVRQAISYLEKVSDYDKNISLETVLSVLGDFRYDTFFDLMNAIIDRDNKTLIEVIEKVYMSGSDLKQFVEMFIEFVLDLSKYTIFNSFDLIKIPKSCEGKLKYTTNVEGSTKYFNHILDKLLELKVKLKGDPNIKNTIEISLLQL